MYEEPKEAKLPVAGAEAESATVSALPVFFPGYTQSMCGRYRLARKKEILVEVLELGDDDPGVPVDV